MRVFRGGRGDASGCLADYLRTVFLEHPWREPDLPSLVLAGRDGAVRGFIGTLPVRMVLQGRPLRGAVGSSVMCAEDDPLAGARLMRAFLQGPQDLSLGEAAADTTRRMWLAQGGWTVPVRSLRWTRILRPAGFAADLAARRLRGLEAARALAAPFDRALDRGRGASCGATGAEVAPEALAEVIPLVLDGFALRPDFDLPVLRWLLSHAARKELRGVPVARLVTGRRGRPAGGWLGHLRRRGVLQVLQVFAAPAEAETMLDDILAFARRSEAVAVSGPAQPELMDGLQLRGCFFRHGDFTLAHARDPAIVAALHRPDAFLNGIAGESWVRLSGSDLV